MICIATCVVLLHGKTSEKNLIAKKIKTQIKFTFEISQRVRDKL